MAPPSRPVVGDLAHGVSSVCEQEEHEEQHGAQHEPPSVARAPNAKGFPRGGSPVRDHSGAKAPVDVMTIAPSTGRRRPSTSTRTRMPSRSLGSATIRVRRRKAPEARSSSSASGWLPVRRSSSSWRSRRTPSRRRSTSCHTSASRTSTTSLYPTEEPSTYARSKRLAASISLKRACALRETEACRSGLGRVSEVL